MFVFWLVSGGEGEPQGLGEAVDSPRFHQLKARAATVFAVRVFCCYGREEGVERDSTPDSTNKTNVRLTLSRMFVFWLVSGGARRTPHPPISSNIFALNSYYRHGIIILSRRTPVKSGNKTRRFNIMCNFFTFCCDFSAICEWLRNLCA